MKKVIFRNKEYVLASVVAERYSYTADYLSELCREGKVDCRMVGNRWYVVAASVADYKATHSSKTKKNKIAVRPVMRTKTLKSVTLSTGVVAPRFQFVPDDTTPVPINKSKPKTATQSSTKSPHPAQPASKVVMPVQFGTDKPVSFKAHKLPAVSLSGDLSVTESTQTPPPKSEDLEDTDEMAMDDAVEEPKKAMIDKKGADKEDEQKKALRVTEDQEMATGELESEVGEDTTTPSFTPVMVTPTPKTRRKHSGLTIAGSTVLALALAKAKLRRRINPTQLNENEDVTVLRLEWPSWSVSSLELFF